MSALELTATASQAVQPRQSHGNSANLLNMPSIADNEGLAHDAGNLLAALGLYCDLLSRPGVVVKDCQHYVQELRHLSERSSDLIRRFLVREEKNAPVPSHAELALLEDGWPVVGGQRGIPPLREGGAGACQQMANAPATHAHVGEILRSSAGLIERLAGPKVRVEMESRSLPDELLLSKEDLERILVNLTRNATAAMPDGGSLRITLQQGTGRSFLAGGTQRAGERNGQVLLCVQDSGPGMPADVAERASSARFAAGLGIHAVPVGNSVGAVESVGTEESIGTVESAGAVESVGTEESIGTVESAGAVESAGTVGLVNTGESERPPNLARKMNPAQRPRGFGLRIVRELVESAGGTIRFVSRPWAGTRVEMEWPVIRRKTRQEGFQVAGRLPARPILVPTLIPARISSDGGALESALEPGLGARLEFALEAGADSGSRSVPVFTRSVHVVQGAAPEATRLARTKLERTKPLQLKSNRVFHKNLEYSSPRRNTMPFPTQGPVIPGQLVRGVQTRQHFSLVVATATKDCGSC